jgi:tetratricopeptide (TPR) repeat protein
MPAIGRTLLPALLIAGASIAAQAQQPKQCELDEGSPNQVARAVLDIQLAQTATKPQDALPKLRDAVKLLSEADPKRNPVGKSFVLGKTLGLWLTQPSVVNGVASRGSLGFTTDTAAKYDVIAGIDSAFTVVESSNPECATQTAAYRQQTGWVNLINRSLEFSNSGNTDSAVVLAKRSLQLSKNAPYAYVVLAQAAQKGNQPKEAIANFKQAIALAKDTSMADNRRQWLMTMGNYASELAEDSQGADKQAYVSEAKAAFEQLAKDPGTKFADVARNGQARVAQLSGDTTAIKASYADQLANPGAFSYNSLMMAAVTAAKTNQSKDAIKLFEAARKVNPYHRDVLYNLARLYLLDSAYAQAIPVSRELINVDPSNPDNYQLLAIGYAAIQKNYGTKEKELEARARALGQRANTAKTQVAKNAAIDSAARLDKQIKAYTDTSKVFVDSALKYQTAMTSLPAKVVFNEFSPTDAKTTIGGTVQNLGDAAKTFTLKIDFLDKTGNTVTSQTLQVGPVDPKGGKPFKAEATGAGIVAFKYAPLT